MTATGHRIGVGAVLLTMLAGTASAQRPTSAQATVIRSACRADYQSHCGSVSPGGSAALQCLMQNAPSLSPGCQQALNAVQGSTAGAPTPTTVPPTPPAMGQPTAPTASMRQACGFDYRRYCRGIRPGGGRALACLQSNRDRLSQTCLGALAAMQSRLRR